MSKTRKRIVVATIVVLQLASIAAIAFFAVREWAWKTQATMFAGYNGSDNAKDDFRRGIRRILELKVIDSNARDYSGPSYDLWEKASANRREGPFEVWFIIIPSAFYSPPTHAYIESYNRAMRIRLDKPEWFTPEGDRIPRKAKPQAAPGSI